MGIVDRIRKWADPKFVRSHIRYSMRSQQTGPSFSPERALKGSNPWALAAATLNAQAVASVPLRLYASPKANRLWEAKKVSKATTARLRGDTPNAPSPAVLRKAAEIGGDFVEITESHPLLKLLSDANPTQGGYELAYLRTLWLEMTGNAFIHVVKRDDGTPVELWPMYPSLVKVLPDPARIIGGYLYGQSGSEVALQPDEVLHFRIPNPIDPLWGRGKAEVAWEAIQRLNAIDNCERSFFANMARPDYAVIIRNTDASEEELDAFQNKIKERTGGTGRSGSFIAVTGDVDFRPLSFANQNWSAQKYEAVEAVAAVFGVPVSMLKTNDPNLASARAGYAQWRETTVLPLLRFDESVLNERLLPMFGLEGEALLAYDSPVPADRQFDLSRTLSSVGAGVMTINEARESQGLPKSDEPGADKLRLPPDPASGTGAADGGMAGLMGMLGGAPGGKPEEKPKEGEAKPDGAEGDEPATKPAQRPSIVLTGPG